MAACCEEEREIPSMPCSAESRLRERRSAGRQQLREADEQRARCGVAPVQSVDLHS